MNHHGSIRAVKRVVMSKWSKNLQAWLETTCSPKKNAKLGGDNHKYKQNLPIKTLGNPFISIKTRNLQKGDADAMGCSTNWLPGLFFAKSMCFLPCFLLVIKIQSFWPPLTPLESTVRIRFFVADFAAQRVNFFNQRVQQLLTMLVAKKHEMVVDFFVGSSFYHIFSTMVDMLHLHQEGGRDSDRWYIYIYIHMIFIYGLSCVLFVWYFWVTCPSDFFLGSEGPKAAASAGSLVTLRDASLSPPTDVYNWKGSTHKHTQSCWRFKSQGIQHSTNIGLAWCSANSFLSIQPCCSNPWACHSTSARFCNNKKLAAAEANQVHFLISNPYY